MPESALVMLPGLMCDRAAFAPVLPALAPHIRCVVPCYAHCTSIEAMAQSVLREAPARFALLGHSMGGRVALEIVRRAPQRVERLALLDTGYRRRAAGDDGNRETEQRMALVAIARRDGMRAMADEWVRTPMVHRSRLDDDALIESIVGMFARHTPDQFEAQVAALLARPDASDVLAAIRCPTLVLCGRDDAWATYERHVDIHRRVAGSTLVAIDRCGHMVTMERPEQAARAIVDWLEPVSRHVDR